MRVFISLIRQITTWDRTSQLALALAIGLLIVSVIVATTVPELQRPATIGAVGLFIAAQVIVLWGNRNLVTPHTEAQRHALAGDFAAARDTLLTWQAERAAQNKSLAVESLVLLGNSYRNLGDLTNSIMILQQAEARDSESHFALYSLGRAYLAKAQYGDAVIYLEKALANGAPDIAHFDLVHAEYRRRNFDAVRDRLPTLPESDEHHRRLFVAFLYHQLMDAAPPDASLIEAGLPFWRAERDRFAHTPYSESIAHDVIALEELS